MASMDCQAVLHMLLFVGIFSLYGSCQEEEAKLWAYIGMNYPQKLKRCNVSPIDGSFEACVDAKLDGYVGKSFTSASNGKVYVHAQANGPIYDEVILSCTVSDDTGEIGFCSYKNLSEHLAYNAPIVIQDDRLFFASDSHLFSCDISSGPLKDCSEIPDISMESRSGYDLFYHNGKLYIANDSESSSYLACDISSSGTALTNCFTTGPEDLYTTSDASVMWGDYLYLVDDQQVLRCSIAGNGEIIDCLLTGPSVTEDIWAITANENLLYIVAREEILVCKISEEDGLLGDCKPASDNFDSILDESSYLNFISIYPSDVNTSGSSRNNVILTITLSVLTGFMFLPIHPGVN